MNFPKASPFLFIGIVLSSLLSFVVNAQSLLDYRNTLENFSGSIQVIKNHHPNDVLRKTELAIHDIPHILDVKDSLPKIEYLRLKFKTQKELDSLCSFLPLFPNLKAISFDEWFYRDNAHKQMALVLPEACYTLHKLVAIEFRGQSKINVEQELARISKLPNFRYLICTAFNPDDFPRNIAALKKLRGISFTYDATLKGIKLPANLEEIDIVALRDSASLADALGMVTNPKKVKQLAISYFRLGKDFKSSVKFPALASICLYANEFQDLGAFLSNFNASRHLRSIAVERGKIAMISSAIYDFRNLRKLKIYNTRGGLTIPDGIAKLRHLARLDLSANGRADIPEDLYKLKSLQQLDLSYIGLASLPEDIGLLANLRQLKLEGNRLVKLPNSINNLHGLTTLNVQGNLLTQIPSLSNLTSLDSLNLSGCRLTTLPTDIGALQSLRYLSVGDNLIERLPSSMTQLMLLSELLLARNLLSELMDDIGSLEQLEQLNLSLNHLKTLPISMGRLKRLKTLNLSQNVLTTIPEEIGTLSNLEYFYAQNNVPTRDPLHDSFGEDDRKRERQMAVSRLHTFPKDLSAWRNIKEIDLSYNDFSSFDILQSVFAIPAKDFELNLSDSRLKTLPVSGWRNFRGRKLDLLNNDIDELPEKIAEAPQLSVLDLRKNRLPERPKNQNTYAGKRNDVLLYFEQVGLIGEDDLPKNKDMALALMEKSSCYYYEKDYKSSLEMHSRALAIDSNLVFARCNAQYIGEANYHMHNYTAAIDYLTRAIQRDTVGPVRIMNFVVPEFKYRAKSYLARKDTSKALADYLALANRFDETFWTQVAMLYGQTSQVDDAQEALQKAVDYYERQVNGQDVRKDQKELSMLCILELYIVCNQFERAAAYAQAIESSLTEDNLQPIFDYLCAINDIVSRKPSHFSPDVFKRQISSRWGYDLVLEWLSTAPLDKKQASVIGDMTSGMVANRMK